MTKVFILGATGFIGGSVLAGLLKAHPDLEITALVRKPENVAAVEALSPGKVAVVAGTKADLDAITAAAKAADVVVSALDNDDVALAKALIAGLEARAKAGAGGPKPVLINTSGTGVIGEGTDGSFREGKTYDDSKPEDIKSIPAANPHRAVDLEVFAAQARGLILTYTISPAAIYGLGKGPSKRVCIALQLLVHLALKHSGAPVVNAGTAVWTDVFIDDVVDLFVKVFDKAVKDAADAPPATAPADVGAELPDSAYSNFYFASGHELTWTSWAETINAALIKAGKLPAGAKPVSVTLEQEPYMWWAGSNTRPVAARAKALGWAPKGPTFAEELDGEIEALLKPMVF